MDGSTLARDLGNRTGALPFTVVLDRAGKLIKSHLGLITEEELDKLLDNLPRTHPLDAAKSG